MSVYSAATAHVSHGHAGGELKKWVKPDLPGGVMDQSEFFLICNRKFWCYITCGP